MGDILFGKKSPSGILPVPFVSTINDLPPYEDYNMQNRTYRYLRTDPLYPFGFGLSYTNFRYNSIRTESGPNQLIKVEIDITNTGTFPSDEIVQLYISKAEKSDIDPNLALKQFQRIHLTPGASKRIIFNLNSTTFSEYDDSGNLKLHKGDYYIFVGSSAPVPRSLRLGAPAWQTVKIGIN